METSSASSAPAHTASKADGTLELVGVLVILIKPCTEQDQHRYDELQKLRHRHDQAFNRWLPHITLIPPFILSSPSLNDAKSPAEAKDLISLHEQKLSQIAQAAQEVCKHHQAHSLLFDQVSTFPLRAYKNVHLRPFPTNFEDKGTNSASSSPAKSSADVSGSKEGEDHSSRRVVELQKELADAVEPLLRPDGEPQAPSKKSQRRNVFKPHASVGQSTSPKATWQLCTSAEKVLKAQSAPQLADKRPGLLCNVDRVQLMVKQKGYDGPYQIHAELPLSKT